MREVHRSQFQLGQVPVEKVWINPKSRDDIPAVLKGLQHIWCDEAVRARLFVLLDEHILPEADRTVGRPGMDLWQILVLGVLKQGLGCDFDRLHELTNHHDTLRAFLGHSDFGNKTHYEYQTVVDNVSLLTPELLSAVGRLVVESGHKVAKKKPGEPLRGRCDSFVVETKRPLILLSLSEGSAYAADGRTPGPYGREEVEQPRARRIDASFYSTPPPCASAAMSPNRPAARREPVSEPCRAGAGQRACSLPLLPRRGRGLMNECWMRAMLRARRLALAATLLVAAACGQDSGEAPGRNGPTADVAWFTDTAPESGLDFVHVNGMYGRYQQPEIMGPGVALLDYDNDGDLDVYLVQGGTLGTEPQRPAPPEGLPLADRLYRNDLAVHAGGERTLRFTDVTDESGITARGYGMGVATGDIDNDGRVDLYLTRFGANQMFRNRGDGTFVEVSAASGTDDPSWGVSAAFVDADRDGWLDLFVGNYLAYSLDTHVPCVHPSGRRETYCAPETYRAQPSRFYRNRGDGTFLDATAAAGMAREFGPALGVATADVDGDGWIDIFVANDQQENQLWMNQRDGTFRNLALLAGVALGGAGSAKADMGVDFGDLDNDGDEDLFVTELTGQGSTLYVNDGAGRFEDRSAQAGIRLPSLPYTGFGAGWFDADNDGWLDLLAVNGLIVHDRDAPAGHPFPLDQRNQFLRNLGDGRFEDATGRAGAVFELSEVSRGAGFGDIDNDGDTDVVVTNAAGPVRLLVNGIGNRNHWIGLRLVGAGGARDMVGARVAVTRSDGATLWRRARVDGSYASASDPRVLVGLGPSAAPPRVRVLWPGGRIEEWSDVPVDRYTTLTEGTGG